MSSGTARWTRRRSTSSSTSRPCGPWRCPGREVHHEHSDHGRPGRRISDVSTGAGLSTPYRGADAPVVRPVRRRIRAPRACDDRTRPAMGPLAGAGGPAVSGPPAGSGAGRWPGTWSRASPGTEVPPRGLLGPAHARRPAFLYSEADIAALLDAARSLAPVDGLRPRTYATLIGLMACTGLRINEALTLGADDVDLDAGVLTIRQTKFHKSRLVPLHATALGPLRDYVAARDRRHRRPTRHDLLRLGRRPAVALLDRAAHVSPAAPQGHAGGRTGGPRTASPSRPAALRLRAAA